MKNKTQKITEVILYEIIYLFVKLQYCNTTWVLITVLLLIPHLILQLKGWYDAQGETPFCL